MKNLKWLWIGGGACLAVILTVVLLVTTLGKDVKAGDQIASEITVEDTQVPMADSIAQDTVSEETTKPADSTVYVEETKEETKDDTTTPATTDDTTTPVDGEDADTLPEAEDEDENDSDLSNFSFRDKHEYVATESGFQVMIPYDTAVVTRGSSVTIKVVVESDAAFSGGIGTACGANYDWAQTDFESEGGVSTWTFKADNVTGDSFMIGIWRVDGTKVGVVSVGVSAVAGEAASNNGNSNTTKPTNGLKTDDKLKFMIAELAPGFNLGDDVRITAKLTGDGYFLGTVGAAANGGWTQLGSMESNGGSVSWVLDAENAGDFFEVQLWYVGDGVYVTLDSVSVEITKAAPVGLKTNDKKVYSAFDLDPNFEMGDTITITAKLTGDGYYNGNVGGASGESNSWVSGNGGGGFECGNGSSTWSVTVPEATGYFEVQVWWANPGVYLTLDSVSISVTKAAHNTDKDDENNEETETPGEGENQNPGSGESQNPGSGESQNPGSGESQNPGSGETQNPGTEGGNTENPGTEGGNGSEEQQPEETKTVITVGNNLACNAKDFAPDFEEGGDFTVAVTLSANGAFSGTIGASSKGGWDQLSDASGDNGTTVWTLTAVESSGYFEVQLWWAGEGVEVTVESIVVTLPGEEEPGEPSDPEEGEDEGEEDVASPVFENEGSWEKGPLNEWNQYQVRIDGENGSTLEAGKDYTVTMTLTSDKYFNGAFYGNANSSETIAYDAEQTEDGTYKAEYVEDFTCDNIWWETVGVQVWWKEGEDVTIKTVVTEKEASEGTEGGEEGEEEKPADNGENDGNSNAAEDGNTEE